MRSQACSRQVPACRDPTLALHAITVSVGNFPRKTCSENRPQTALPYGREVSAQWSQPEHGRHAHANRSILLRNRVVAIDLGIFDLGCAAIGPPHRDGIDLRRFTEPENFPVRVLRKV